MLAGGADAAVIPSGLGGFIACKALSKRNEDPASASRPWDRQRDGFVMGEGAGVLLAAENVFCWSKRPKGHHRATIQSVMIFFGRRRTSGLTEAGFCKGSFILQHSLQILLRKDKASAIACILKTEMWASS